MKATITSNSLKDSKYGGKIFFLTFKGEDGKSYQTWIVPGNWNFSRWEEIVKLEAGAVIDNLIIKKGHLIDADSFPKICQDIPKPTAK